MAKFGEGWRLKSVVLGGGDFLRVVALEVVEFEEEGFMF